MIKVVGTIHIMPLKDEIKSMMSSLEGWHVAIELDPERLYLMINKDHRTQNHHMMSGPFIVKLLYLIEKKIAEKLGQSVGVDMLSAYELARELDMKVSLIDIPIAETIRKLMKTPTKERLKLFIESLLMFFAPIGRKINLEQLLDIKNLENMTMIFKRRYPVMYKILVEDRDRHLFERIIDLENIYGNVIAFVGALHALNLRKMFEKDRRIVTEIEYHRTFFMYTVK